MRILLALFFVALASPAFADQKAAEEDILLTVHGTQKVTWQGDTVRLDMVPVPGVTDFYAGVTCGLLAKYGVTSVKEAVLFDVAVPEGDPIGKADCTKPHSEAPKQ